MEPVSTSWQVGVDGQSGHGRTTRQLSAMDFEVYALTSGAGWNRAIRGTYRLFVGSVPPFFRS